MYIKLNLENLFFGFEFIFFFLKIFIICTKKLIDIKFEADIAIIIISIIVIFKNCLYFNLQKKWQSYSVIIYYEDI